MRSVLLGANRPMACTFRMLVLVLLSIPLAASADDAWRFSTVDECSYAARYFGSTIHLTASNRLEVVYQRDPNRGSGMSYAVRDTGSWTTSHIQADCSVFSLRSAADSVGTPHVLYSAFNCKSEGLKYAVRQGEQWQTAVVYSKPSPSEGEMMRRFGCNRYSLNLMVSDSNDLTVDRDGGVHTVYADPEGEEVVYGYRARGARHWNWESIEKVGNHRLTASRINPVVRVSPAGEVWVVYKKYTRRETPAGAKWPRIELRLATKTVREWKCRTIVDGLGFIDGKSKILFGPANERFVAYTKCAAGKYGDPTVKWLLVERDGGKWMERYEGEPREQLLTAAWVGGHFHMLMTRVRPDKPNDGTVLQDTLVRLSKEANWEWKTENVLELKDKQALAAAINRYGDAHVLFASSSAISSMLEYGILKMGRGELQQHAPADADKPRH